jgi:hypothetical protein
MHEDVSIDVTPPFSKIRYRFQKEPHRNQPAYLHVEFYFVGDRELVIGLHDATQSIQGP